MNTTKQYIDIDSTYRDRNAYPNPADFVIENPRAVDNGSNNVFRFIDPITKSYMIFPPADTAPLTFYAEPVAGVLTERLYLPYMFVLGNDPTVLFLDGLPVCDTDPTAVVDIATEESLITSPNAYDNAYIGKIIQDVTNNEYRTIISSNYIDQELILQNSYVQNVTVTNNVYKISFSDQNNISLSPSSVNRFYVGKIMTINGEDRLITDYVFNGHLIASYATVESAFTSVSPGDVIEIKTQSQFYVTINSAFTNTPTAYPAYLTTSGAPLIYKQPIMINPTNPAPSRILTYSIDIMSDSPLVQNIVWVDALTMIVYFSQSTDMGVTWGTPVAVTTALAYNIVGKILLSNNGDGVPCVQFYDKRTTPLINSMVYIRATSTTGAVWNAAQDFDFDGTAVVAVPFPDGVLTMPIVASNIQDAVAANRYPIIIVTSTGTVSAPGLLVSYTASALNGSGNWTKTTIDATGARSGILGGGGYWDTTTLVHYTMSSAGATNPSNSIQIDATDTANATAWAGIAFNYGVVSNNISVNFIDNSPSMWGEFICYQEVGTGNIYVQRVGLNTFANSLNIRTLVATDGRISNSSMKLAGTRGVTTQPVYLVYTSSNDEIKISDSSDYGTTWTSPKVLFDADTLNNVQIVDAGTAPLIYAITSNNYSLVDLTTSATGVSRVAGSQYRLRESQPYFYNNSNIISGSTTTAKLAATASTTTGEYVGKYIWIHNKVIASPLGSVYQFNDIRLITAYNGTTQTVTVTPPFSADINTYIATNTITYDIMNAESVDGYNPLTILGTDTLRQQPTAYEMRLESITLPNKTLYSGDGNRIAFYPYIYVEIRNENSTYASNIINSNNPYASKALFRIPIYNVNQPTVAVFVVLEGRGMDQVVRFKPCDNFRFRVLLPNGDVFLTEADNASPLPPDPALQISMVLSFRRV